MDEISPREMAGIFARNISAMTDSEAAGPRMAITILFVGIEASRATTNYAIYTSKGMARLTSNTAKTFGQNAKK